MLGRKLLVSLMLASLMSYPAFALTDYDVIMTKSREQNYEATRSKNAVNQEALEEAQREYASAESELDIDIVPLFQDWTKRQAQRKINNIGNKLLISNNLDNFARFEVSRKEAVNASANFNGTVTVYKGLLEYVETDDELAYVLGHELGHITNDDSKKSIWRAVAATTVAVGATVAVAAASNSKGATASTATGSGIAAGATSRVFSRRAETNADKRGIDYMVKAGYNPLAAISMMNKIMNRRWSGLSDHSSGSKRMLIAYQYIAEKYPKYLVAGYNSVSYDRAMVHINSQLAKKNKNKPTKSNNGKEFVKESEI
ncbi:M48 family metallopeptidase [bacterium]|nr:M48 family metallopeptidase [bacterium]